MGDIISITATSTYMDTVANLTAACANNDNEEEIGRQSQSEKTTWESEGCAEARKGYEKYQSLTKEEVIEELKKLHQVLCKIYTSEEPNSPCEARFALKPATFGPVGDQCIGDSFPQPDGERTNTIVCIEHRMCLLMKDMTPAERAEFFQESLL